MEAKCPRCEDKVIVNEDMTYVKCNNCDYKATYSEYIEQMKERVSSMISDFRDSINKGL